LEFSEGRTRFNECSCQKEARIKAKIEKFKELSITSRNSGKDSFKNAILGNNKAENELYRIQFYNNPDGDSFRNFSS